ncbi:MAG: hypothetical protein ABIQ93_01490 [Saprospiraceae bacterium]
MVWSAYRLSTLKTLSVITSFGGKDAKCGYRNHGKSRNCGLFYTPLVEEIRPLVEKTDFAKIWFAGQRFAFYQITANLIVL